MPRIFRKIRMTVLNNNRVAKYILYAFGEILLVVIGILLALQINNWREQNMQRVEENRILMNIKADLISDTLQLQRRITMEKNIQKYLDSIYLALERPNAYSPDIFFQYIGKIMWNDLFEVNSGTFDESLSSSSLKFIRNDQLRQLIFRYYRKSKVNISDASNLESRQQLVLPIIQKLLTNTKQFHSYFLGRESYFDDIDILGLSKNEDFSVAINSRYISSVGQIVEWNIFKEYASQLIDEINNELKING